MNGKHNSEPKSINTTKDTAKTFEWIAELPWGSSNQNSQPKSKSCAKSEMFGVSYGRNFSPKEFLPP